MSARAALTGTVTSFSADRGYGEVTGRDGQVFFLHCTRIADGTRTIETGAAVSFTIEAGRRGRWEAADVRPMVDAVRPMVEAFRPVEGTP